MCSGASKIEARNVSISNPTVSSREPHMYSIGAVTRMTGIPEATLRVWERRYHFPRTDRTHGGHRLYSQDDIQLLRWVKLRIDEGMRTGQAIRARQHTHRAAAVTAALHEPLPAPAPSDPQLVATCSTLLDALMDYNSAQAAAILDDALARFAFENVALDVVGSAMAIIGDL